MLSRSNCYESFAEERNVSEEQAVMKRRLCLFIVVVAIAVGVWLLYARCVRTYQHHLYASSDVYAALIYYLEDNRCFPDSPASLLASPFVVVRGDGTFVVRGRRNSDYAPNIYGEPISDLSAFGIRWGTDLSTLRIQGEVVVLDQNGDRVLLLNYAPLDLNAEYTSALLKVYQELTKRDK